MDWDYIKDVKNFPFFVHFFAFFIDTCRYILYFGCVYIHQMTIFKAEIPALRSRFGRNVPRARVFPLAQFNDNLFQTPVKFDSYWIFVKRLFRSLLKAHYCSPLSSLPPAPLSPKGVSAAPGACLWC